MKSEEFWDAMVLLAENDDNYQQALEKVKKLEPAYLAIKASLPPEQQQTLDDYIAACEALEESQVYLAARLSLTGD